jgi:hypothetical protein
VKKSLKKASRPSLRPAQHLKKYAPGNYTGHGIGPLPGIAANLWESLIIERDS